MKNRFQQIYKRLIFIDFAITFDSGIVLEENRVSIRAGVTQLVECDLAKVDVAGSNPVSRSILLPSELSPSIRV